MEHEQPCDPVFLFSFCYFFCGRGAFKFAKHCGFPPCGCKFDKLVPLLRSAVCGKSGSLMWNSACALLRTEALVQRGQTLGAVPHWGNMNQIMSKCCLASTNGSKADKCVSELHRSTFFTLHLVCQKSLNITECLDGILWFKKFRQEEKTFFKGNFALLTQCRAEC